MYRVICGICIILSLWLLPTNNVANAERILVITIAPFYSHQIVHRMLCLALNKRGHEIVVLTPYPIKDPTLKNYTEIDTSAILPVHKEYSKQLSQLSPRELNRYILELLNKLSDVTLNVPKFKDLYRNDSNEKFDAVIVEGGPPVLYSLAYRFNAPLIASLSLGLHNFHRYVYGSPILTSHSSNWEVPTLLEENPSIWQRLENFIEIWSYLYYWNNHFIPIQDTIGKKHLGYDTPYIIDIAKNMRLILVNENPVFVYPRPEQTNAIFFSGLQIQKTLPPLPKDLGQFLDNATEGFIYVSFGTTVTCENFPKEIVEIFIKVFSKLSYKIVWKFDCDELPRKLDNALISKWFPQGSVLAHPNIKLFIYQGGLQSTEEAVYYTVPILGIPFMNEQAVRIRRLVSLRATEYLKLNEITEENLYATIHQIINDKSYKERITHLSLLTKDQPYDSMEHVIWWIEFTMRHKEANHLRFSESDNPWYQRYDIDIIALLAITLFILICVIVLIIFKMFCFILSTVS